MKPDGGRTYSSPLRAEQAAATRDRIVDATVALLQGADPSGFGMQDVADHAGVSVRTVYRAFPTKDDLLDGVLATIRERFDRIAGPPPATREEFDAAIPAAVGAVFELEPLYRALFATTAGREVHQGSAAARRAAFEVAFAKEFDGLPDDQVRNIVAVLHLVTSSRSVLWLKDYAGLDAEAASEAIEFAVAAIATAAGKAKR